MFYKYTVKYPNGTKFEGYAQSDKSEFDVRRGIEKQFFGMFALKVEECGTAWPQDINSDYVMSI